MNGSLCNQEEWRAVVGFHGYEVSNRGQIRSRLGGSPRVLLQLHLTNSGKPESLAARLYIHGRQHTRKVHRLVLEAFVGAAPAGTVGCHNDGDPTNNHVANLRWDTPLENALDKERHGTMVRGDIHPRSLLTADQVRHIKSIDCWVPGAKAEIARKFGVSRKAITEILHDRAWRHIQ